MHHALVTLFLLCAIAPAHAQTAPAAGAATSLGTSQPNYRSTTRSRRHDPLGFGGPARLGGQSTADPSV